nr:TlpA disulfide reductase family protein [bacterium]
MNKIFLTIFILPVFLFAENLKKGEKIPAVSGKTLADKIFSAANYKGKYILIDIGSTMCLPCQETLKQFQKLKKKYPELEVITINIDGAAFRKQVKDFVARNKITFPVILDDSKSLYALFKSEVIPYIIFADKTGKIINTSSGEEIDIDKKFELQKYFFKQKISNDDTSVLIEQIKNKQEDTNILAVINDEKITIEEFNEIFNSLNGQTKAYFQNNPKELLNELVNQKLLYFGALNAGIEQKKDVRLSIDRTVRNIIIQSYIEEMFKNVEQEKFKQKLNEHIAVLEKKSSVKIFDERINKFEPKIERIKLPAFIKTERPIMIDLGSGT